MGSAAIASPRRGATASRLSRRAWPGTARSGRAAGASWEFFGALGRDEGAGREFAVQLGFAQSDGDLPLVARGDAAAGEGDVAEYAVVGELHREAGDAGGIEQDEFPRHERAAFD